MPLKDPTACTFEFLQVYNHAPGPETLILHEIRVPYILYIQ